MYDITCKTMNQVKWTELCIYLSQSYLDTDESRNFMENKVDLVEEQQY